MMKLRLLTYIPALFMLMFLSCSDMNQEPPVIEPSADEEYVDVMIKVTPDASMIVDPLLDSFPTRDGEDKGPGSEQKYYGKGEKIDMLIYAVYQVNRNEDTKELEGYTFFSQYGKGIVDKDGTPSDKPNNNVTSGFENKAALKDWKTVHHGHTIVDVTGGFPEGGCEVNLRLMRGKEYSIVFWAQNSECDAYDTSDLENVKVDYSKAENNDETRDAFCKVESFSVSSQENGKIEVYLKRPFAQINAGGKLNGNYKNIEYSKTTVAGVYSTMDVLRDLVPAHIDDEPITAVFDWAQCPNEESLFVDYDYNTNYTEYKYLSLCYVLAPVSTDYEGQDKKFPAVFSQVTVEFKQEANGNAIDNLKMNPTLVPTYRNWRTNLLDTK